MCMVLHTWWKMDEGNQTNIMRQDVETTREGRQTNCKCLWSFPKAREEEKEAADLMPRMLPTWGRTCEGKRACGGL